MPDYQVNWHHRLVSEALERVANRDLKRLMIFQPPRTGKSELVSRRLPAYLLGSNPDLKILSCSHTSKLAENMNLDCQRIMDTDVYRRLFGDARIPRAGRRETSPARRQSSYFELVGRRGSLQTAGVGQKIAGQGADLAIADDLFGSWEDAVSETTRQAIWDWWTKDFLTRLSRGAPVVLTHTRWHQDDVAGRELRQMLGGEGEPWEVISLPAIYEGGEKHPGDMRQPGEALWPDRQPLNELLAMKARDLSGFEALYQQNPRGSGLVEWPDEYFQDIFYTQIPPNLPVRFRLMVLDPAMGKSAKTGDFPALVYAIIDGQNPFHIWIDDSSMRVMPVSDVEDTAVAFIGEKRPDAMLIETNGFQELVAANIIRKAASIGNCPPIKAHCSTENKEVAIRLRLSQTLAEHRIHFRSTPFNRIIVEQLQAFPTGKHDDGPDALRLIFPLLEWCLSGNSRGIQYRSR